MSFTKKKNEKRKNKTRKLVKGGVLPVILIENAPLIISGIGAAFNLIINWVITANKTIDNYRAVEKLSTTVTTLAKKPASKPVTSAPTPTPTKPGPTKPKPTVKSGPTKPATITTKK